MVAYLSGELPQRQIGVGWAALRSVPPASVAPSLTVLGVDAAFTRDRGGGRAGVGRRAEAAGRRSLSGAATAEEQFFLVRLLSGELRQGALDGVMTEAVARASEVPVARGAAGGHAAAGRSPAAAQAALERRQRRARRGSGCRSGSRSSRCWPPSEPSVEAALAKIAADAAGARARARAAGRRPVRTGRHATATARPAVEWKLDGIRVQAHVSGRPRSGCSRARSTTSPTRLPEVVAALSALPVRTAVFDGELIALRPDGRPYAFQDTASRAASQTGAARRRRGWGGRGRPSVPLSAFLFDALHLDGADLIDLPDAERRAALAGVVPAEMLMPRLVTADTEEADAFFRDAVARGHEGVVVKSLATPYAAGRRGAGWIKVKPRHTLDLVVLAVEWGHGRRKGWLSNLHLGARDPDTGGWVMLGKTFKGLTDELLTWQTARLLELEDHRDDWTVYVRPELVVEIAFDGVQRSPRYPGGVALRFARVLRYREDKPAAEADTIDSVRDLAAD